MKKHIAFALILSSLFAISCAKQGDSNSRVIARKAAAGTSPKGAAPTPAAQAQQAQADSQSQAVGLNISWQQTELNSDDNASSAVQTFTINGQSYKVTTPITAQAPDCSLRANLDYSAEMANTAAVSGLYAAVGHTTCQNGNNLFLGLNFMAWRAGGYMVQEMILINLTTDGETQVIQKILSSPSTSVFLPDWISNQFVGGYY